MRTGAPKQKLSQEHLNPAIHCLAGRLPLATKTIMFVGSFCKGLTTITGDPTKMMVLVVEGRDENKPRTLLSLQRERVRD